MKCNDNCSNVVNRNQEVADGDDFGNDCDDDNDGINDLADNCPTVINPDQDDTDNDDIGNLCDNCTDTPNPDNSDHDNDGLGNLCNPDDDNDGVDRRQPEDLRGKL